MRHAFLAAAGAVLMIAGCPADRGGALPSPLRGPADAGAAVDSNDMCHVCHIPFDKEPLTTVHAGAKVWCIRCHGPSARHMQDENIGATPPDVVYRKNQVDRMCSRCHDAKRHPGLAPEVRAARLARGKKAQSEIKGRPVEPAGVCTDCHGSHWIPPRG